MRRRLVVLGMLVALAVVPGAAAWTWPSSGQVLRPFSLGADPYAAGQHRGVDIGGAAGEPVSAPAAGAVTFAGTVPTHGKTVTIETANGHTVTLTHLGSIAVVKGVSVEEGDRVGDAGTSGESEWPEPYVHLGVRMSSEPEGYLDPLRFLPPRERPAPAPAAAPPASGESPALRPADLPLPDATATPSPQAASVSTSSLPESNPVSAAVSDSEAGRAASPIAASATAGEPQQEGGAAALSAASGAHADGAPAGTATVALHSAEMGGPAASTMPNREMQRRKPNGRPQPRVTAVDPVRPRARDLGFRAVVVPLVVRAHTLTAEGIATSSGAATSVPSEPSSVRRTQRVAPTLPPFPATGDAPAHADPALAGVEGPPASLQHPWTVAVLGLAAALTFVLALLHQAYARRARMMTADVAPSEDPRGSGMAVCERPTPYRACGGLRGAVRRVRPLPPPSRQRRLDDQRHGRARHPDHGRRRSGRRLSA